MRDWSEPVCTHGDSEETVRVALGEAALEALADSEESVTLALRQMGASESVIGDALEMLRTMVVTRIESRVECVMRDMAITAGAVSVH